MNQKTPQQKHRSQTIRVAATAIFTALAVVGSYIPIPGPIPSFAFDSCAGFFAAMYFGMYEGAFVLGVGHLATAAVHGFPYGWLHIPIAAAMALAGVAIALAVKASPKWGFIPGSIAAVIINTVVVFPLAPWLGGIEVAIALVPALVIGATINVVIAAIAYVAIRGKIKI
jgi:riboflavin transporter